MTQLSFSIENILKEDFPNRYARTPKKVLPLRFALPGSRMDGDLCFPVYPYNALRYGPIVYHLGGFPDPKEQAAYSSLGGLWYGHMNRTRSKELPSGDEQPGNCTKSLGEDRPDIPNRNGDELPKTELNRQRECTQVLKKKRFRSHFSQRQLKYLENVFSRQQYLSRDERALLAKALEMTELQIRNWFQNRRYQKRQREIHVQKQKEESATCEEKDG